MVELWDRVYQAWVAAHPPTHATGPVVTSEAVAMSFDSLMEGLKRTPGNFPHPYENFYFTSVTSPITLLLVVTFGGHLLFF